MLKINNILSVLKDIGVIRYEDKGNIGNKNSDNPANYKIVYPNDIVLNSMNFYIGSVGISKELGVTSSVYIILVLNPLYENLAQYFYFVFKNNLFQKYAGRLGKGIMEIREAIKYEDLKDEILSVPSLSEQTDIANFLDKKTAQIDALIEKDKKLIELLKEKRTALINHAVTKGLDPNVKLKDSGIDWIGEIPEGWEVDRLKFKETVIMGQSPDSKSYNYEYIGYPFLQGNAEFSDIHPNPSIWCDVANKYALKNDILLSVRAPIGAINIADQKYGIGRGLCAIRVKINNLKYIFYQLITCVDYLNSIGTGSTYTAISTEHVMNLPIRYPPLSEQITIANFLDKQTLKIDKTIQKIEEKIKLLEEYKKSLIHHTVTGKIDVRGLEY